MSNVDMIKQLKYKIKEKYLRVDYLAYLICLLYGISSLVFVSAPGDGTWFLYAQQIIAGGHLYADLHLNQQPLFPILAIFAIKFGNGSVLLDRLFYIFIPLLYVQVAYLISRTYQIDFLKRAVLLLFIFFGSSTFVAFRFDDYNSLTYLLMLASFYLTIKIGLTHNEKKLDNLILLQMLVLSLASLNRLSDGVFVACAFLLCYLYYKGINSKFVLQCSIGILIYLGLLFLCLTCILDETLSIWFQNTILDAAKIKGGSSIALYPVIMVLQSIDFIRGGNFSLLNIFTLVLGLTFLKLSSKANNVLKVMLTILAFAFIGLSIFKFYHNHIVTIAIPFALIGILFVLYVSIFNFLIFGAGPKSQSHDGLILLAYPLFIFFCGSLSSGGHFGDHYFPMVIALVVVQKYFCCDFSEVQLYVKLIINVLIGSIVANSVYIEIVRPYAWHSYYSSPFFSNYVIVRDKKENYNVIQKNLISLIEPVCNLTSGATLLSLPFSFANYYCRTAPWEGHVQSFFDTSSVGKINEIINGLNKSPPNFIFYQRQIDNLEAHENIYNGGRPLPHRRLDELIMGKINMKEWRVIYRSYEYPPSEWLLVQTN